MSHYWCQQTQTTSTALLCKRLAAICIFAALFVHNKQQQQKGILSSITLLLRPNVNATYLIERFSSSNKLFSSTQSSIPTILHLLNANAALILLVCMVWYVMEDSTSTWSCVVLLVTAVITWMKLLSYVHVKRDYR